MISNGLILALLFAKGFEGDVGPFGGEDPVVIENENGAELRLTSQGPDAVYQFNDDGSVDEVWEGDRDKIISDLIDVGFDQEDAEEWYENGPQHYSSVIKLIDDYDRSSWFVYFQEDHPDLYDAITAYVKEIQRGNQE